MKAKVNALQRGPSGRQQPFVDIISRLCTHRGLALLPLPSTGVKLFMLSKVQSACFVLKFALHGERRTQISKQSTQKLDQRNILCLKMERKFASRCITSSQWQADCNIQTSYQQYLTQTPDTRSEKICYHSLPSAKCLS